MAHTNSHFNDSIRHVIKYNYTSNTYPQFKDDFYQKIFKLLNDNEEICGQTLWDNVIYNQTGSVLCTKGGNETT